MMAAAQAAAAAAMREAAAQEQKQQQQQHQQQQPANDLLLQLQQHDSSAAQHILNEMMGIANNPAPQGDNVESILEFMAQHEQQAASAQFEPQQPIPPPQPQLPERPLKHYMTIAQDGTILEATKTITGFPPDALLMTSWYDSVYEDDLPGFVAIKTQFWDNNRPDVESFLRRRTLEGDWIWLATKVVSYIDKPVQGVIVEERLVEDEDHAVQMNRIIRITAILIQGVQTAKRELERKEAARKVLEAVNAENSNRANAHAALTQQIPLVADDAIAYQTWLQQASGQAGISFAGATDPLQSIMAAAFAGGAMQEEKPKEIDTDDPIAVLQRELMSGDKEERKGFDPLSALKAVRGEGTRLDLGMVSLSQVEVKMITLVLTGRLKVEDLAQLVNTALNTPGQSLTTVFSEYTTDFEKKLPEPVNKYGSHSPVSTHHHFGGNNHHYQQPPHQSHHQSSSSRHKSSRSRSKSKSVYGYQQPTNNLGRAYSMSSDPGGPHSYLMQRQTSAPALMATNAPAPPPQIKVKLCPASISVVNLSYTFMGNEGMDMFGEFLYQEGTVLETLDVSFCGMDEKGILALARALTKRKRRGLAPLRGLVVSGNYITYRAAKDLGLALAPGSDESKSRKRSKVFPKGKRSTGYDEDNESDDEDIDDDDEPDFTPGRKRPAKEKSGPCCSRDKGLQVFHFGASSLTPEALYQLLDGLGPHCPVKELSIAANNIGPNGASLLVDFLEAKGKSNHPVMPYLDRLDLSNNELGNDGTARLTRAIAKRVKNPFVDLRLSCNDIGHGGIETIMNKLLQHSILSLSLDKNEIGDQGCQLIAASLPVMHSLSRLNLSFNQIGSRGVSTLMKSLVRCESITFLGLSGNIMKISGAIAMGFTLAQHPRLEELDMDNCCLSQAAQCHIVAGIISNRWVPMKYLNGFQAGPPMTAIGAIGVYGHNLSNEECFRVKRDEQMKTILQWMESNRRANRAARQNMNAAMETIGGFHPDSSQQQYLTPDFVSTMNEVHGTPSQNAYLRMLGWLSKIPFDEDELTSLRDYFYDNDSGDGDRGSDGYINLKLRGDLLAALDSGVADEIRDQLPSEGNYKGSVGLDLETLPDLPKTTGWSSMKGDFVDKMPQKEEPRFNGEVRALSPVPSDDGSNNSNGVPRNVDMDMNGGRYHPRNSSGLSIDARNRSLEMSQRNMSVRGSLSSLSRQSMTRSSSNQSMSSTTTERRSRIKARISMFPPFETKLEELKATAKEMMENEPDPEQQDIILTQYAEASLTILRQLRYHCMNSGLDGWKQGGLRRKVLIVDDSLVTRKMVARAFEKANYIVDTAENGVEGVKKMKASIYDIAFMDIDMPVMNGFEATKALRQWEDKQRPGARQPICALTAAYVDDFERSELMKFKEAGLDVMESKPCNIPRLFKVVDDVSPMFSDLSISVSQNSLS